MTEWMTIEKISSNVFAGGTPSTKHEEYYDGDIPWIRSGEIDFNVITSAERNITKLGYDSSSAKMIRKGSVVMAMTGATVGKTAVVEIETSANQSVCAIETNEAIANYKYVYYCLANDYLKIKASAQGAMTSLNLAMIKQIEIPIPPLSEQQRIVRILDAFSASLVNLKKQIIERKTQFAYYRDTLLDIEGRDGVECKMLEQIVSRDCPLSYGIVQPGDDVKDGVPVVRPVDFADSIYVKREGLKKTLQSVSDAYKRTVLNGDEILFCVRGTTGTMGLATKELKGCNVTRGIVPISFDNEVTKMFVFYQLGGYRLQQLIEEKTNGTALQQINVKDLRQLPLFMPSLPEQARIAAIIRKFEASVENLEAQLNERQQQYEYYREHLINLLK